MRRANASRPPGAADVRTRPSAPEREALRRARRIVSLGYSLPESDLAMKHFLRTTCAPDAEWLIVDRSGEAIAHYERLFRGTGIRVQQTARGRDAIEQFVANVQQGAPPRRRMRKNNG